MLRFERDLGLRDWEGGMKERQEWSKTLVCVCACMCVHVCVCVCIFIRLSVILQVLNESWTFFNFVDFNF